MDTSLPLPTPESSLPENSQRAPERFEGAPNGQEELPSPAKEELLSQANDAVAQAVYGTGQAPITKQQIPPTGSTTQNPTVTVADDVDVIEKEWVQKAKYIVDMTKDDPHRQSIQLSSFKKDYIKTRFGKDIKIPNDQVA